MVKAGDNGIRVRADMGGEQKHLIKGLWKESQ